MGTLETNEISVHQAKVYLVAKTSPEEWFTVLELAKRSGVARRTASMHASRLVSLGVFDLRELFPGHRFRIAAKAEKRNKAHILRLDEAVSVFGLCP
jgi:hypothetical protein